jgi:hypothetical protein
VLLDMAKKQKQKKGESTPSRSEGSSSPEQLLDADADVDSLFARFKQSSAERQEELLQKLLAHRGAAAAGAAAAAEAAKPQFLPGPALKERLAAAPAPPPGTIFLSPAAEATPLARKVAQGVDEKLVTRAINSVMHGPAYRALTALDSKATADQLDRPLVMLIGELGSVETDVAVLFEALRRLLQRVTALEHVLQTLAFRSGAGDGTAPYQALCDALCLKQRRVRLLLRGRSELATPQQPLGGDESSAAYVDRYRHMHQWLTGLWAHVRKDVADGAASDVSEPVLPTGLALLRGLHPALRLRLESQLILALQLALTRATNEDKPQCVSALRAAMGFFTDSSNPVSAESVLTLLSFDAAAMVVSLVSVLPAAPTQRPAPIAAVSVQTPGSADEAFAHGEQEQGGSAVAAVQRAYPPRQTKTAAASAPAAAKTNGRRIMGNCWWCGRRGHCEADCMQKLSNAPPAAHSMAARRPPSEPKEKPEQGKVS